MIPHLHHYVSVRSLTARTIMFPYFYYPEPITSLLRQTWHSMIVCKQPTLLVKRIKFIAICLVLSLLITSFNSVDNVHISANTIWPEIKQVWGCVLWWFSEKDRAMCFRAVATMHIKTLCGVYFRCFELFVLFVAIVLFIQHSALLCLLQNLI